MNNRPVSIILVTWNHLAYLGPCLEAVYKQTYQPVNIVVIDNASVDGSPEFVQSNYPEILLIRHAQNLGFSAALNKGIRSMDAPFVLSLNADVVMEPDCLERMVEAMLSDEKVGIVAPKLLREDNPDLIDSTGLFLSRTRRPYDRGQNQPDQGQYDRKRQVFGACGALALYRREMLDDTAYNLEYFDEDFFAYYEDVDLAWRAHLSGWQAVFEPQAVARHVRGWGDSLRKQRKMSSIGPRLALRNRYLMSLKNERVSTFMIDLPLIIAAEVPRLIYSIFYMPAVLLGLCDVIRLAGKMLRKRRASLYKGSSKDFNLRPWLIKS